MTIDTILKIGGGLLGFAGATVEAVMSHKRADEKIDEMVKKRVNKKFEDLEAKEDIETKED